MPPSKTFIPLESNPSLFTKLIRDVGAMPCLEFRDVYSVSEPSLVALLPRPVLALILVGPTTVEANQEGKVPEYSKKGDEEDIMWFKQTIANACGLYAILHSVANGAARDLIRTVKPLLPPSRMRIIC